MKLHSAVVQNSCENYPFFSGSTVSFKRKKLVLFMFTVLIFSDKDKVQKHTV